LGVEWESIKHLIKFGQSVQHMYFGPPGMNKAAIQAFCGALMPALTSAAFKKDTLKTVKYVPATATHQRAAQVLEAPKATPANVVSFLKGYVAKHSKKKKKKK
jgi:hypothetical protein